MSIRCVAVLSLAAGLVLPGLAASEESGEGEAASASVYQLPKVGKPTGRLGGGRRGQGTDAPELYALVPDHVGYTTSKQPTLYWYLSEGATGNLEFELTLIDETSVDPMIDTAVNRPSRPGLQRIALADHGVTLVPGEEYQWSVALVPDPDDRSKDIVSSGWIEVVPAPKGLEARVAEAGPAGAAGVYGDEGLWYDTLAAAVEQAKRSPADGASRSQLAGLLSGVGLPAEAAEK